MSGMGFHRSESERRYDNDPQFKGLVDCIELWITRCEYTASEVREAAMLAAIHYELSNTRSRLILDAAEYKRPA